MAKFVAVAAVCLAALVAVAVGQSEAERQRLRDLRCWQETQQSPLDACRQVLDRQLTGRMRYAPFQWSTGMRMQCCQQLQDVSRECRCAAIRRMVRGYEQAMPPLEEEGGYYGEQTGEVYYGEGAQRPQRGEGSYGYGEMAGRQQGGGYYGETAAQQQGDQGCRCGQAREEYGGSGGQQQRFAPFRPSTAQQTARVRLTKVRQYGARLPAMCRMEPQECSVFSAGQDY